VSPQRSFIATKACALLALLLSARAAVAEPIGVVADSSGPLLAKTDSGSIKVLAIGSSIERSDVLVSRAGAYVLVTLTDHTAIALGPDTELAIEKYSFHEKDSQADEALLTLYRGRVRVTSGTLGTRDTDTFTLKAGTATVDIHRSVFIAEYVQRAQGELAWLDNISPPAHGAAVLGRSRARDAYSHVQLRSFDTQNARPLELSDSAPPNSPQIAEAVVASRVAALRLSQNTPGLQTNGLNPGLYVQVLDGTIHVTNGGGTQNFTAGQFGFTPGFQQPPVILPNNPGLQFTPPPSFSSTTGSQAGSSAKPGDVDCIVR
jgi:hypothetical protein